MSRQGPRFRCKECGWSTAAYAGRCFECQQWNTLEPVAAPARVPGRPAASRAVPEAQTIALSQVQDDPGERLLTAIPEFDRVLGGGFVPGSLTLVGGDPGIGKSTLMLQAAARLAAQGVRVAYICGEESPRQVRIRAGRLGVANAEITLIPETDLEAALAAAQSVSASVVVIDSIQSMYVAGLESRPGGPAQLAESGARLVTFAKSTDIAVAVTGHVTKGGEVAGPRLLEHLVDAVLYFESAEGGSLRLLRAVKNRFGATDEVGLFEMTGDGLRSVENPSSALLESHDARASGCAVTAVVEGSRPLALEVQALAVQSTLASPRRISSGIEVSRLHLLLAVLARRAGLDAAGRDVVVSVSGGLRLRGPEADLALAAALASAIEDRPLPRATAYLGEVALSGAVRAVQQAPRRLAELGRLGFTTVYAAPGTPAIEGVAVRPVPALRALIEEVLRPS